MTDPIVIKKENDGDTINFFEESSDDSDIQLSRNRRKTFKKRVPKQREQVHIQQVQPQAPQPPQQQVGPRTTLNDNMFEVFTNPDKKRIPEENSEDGSEGNPMNDTPYVDDNNMFHDDMTRANKGGGSTTNRHRTDTTRLKRRSRTCFTSFID